MFLSPLTTVLMIVVWKSSQWLGKDNVHSNDKKELHERPYFNQSVENAGVAFAKGANERDEFFEKIYKQECIRNMSGQTRQRKGLTISGMN